MNLTVERRQWVFVAGGVLLLMLIVFRQVLLPGNALFTTDDNLGALMLRKNLLPQAWWGGWSDAELLGYPFQAFLNLTNLLLWLLPASTFNNWINAFDLAIGSFILIAFLRLRGLAWPACALGALTAYWLGSNFTLVYAGHIGKFGILLWVPAFLWLTERAVRAKSLPLSLLAGGALGAMFLEQADVALFFALALGPYALYAWWRAHGNDWLGMARFAGPLVAVALLLAAHPLLSGYQSAVEGVASVQEEDPEAKWAFVTQWSWPPEESIDFIAPGFTGWRSQDARGPYIGRMGRSAGWEDTGQGFPNFKLENQYLGAVPLFFALLALWWAWPRRRHGNDHARDTLFWGSVTVVTLLLSFGKHFPLYALFYQLPFVSSIRNPNKFLQVFQLALAIVAAYGLHDLIRRAATESGTPTLLRSLRPLLYGGLGLGVLLLLWGMGALAGIDTLTAKIAAEGWLYARTAADTRVWSLFHGAVAMLLTTALTWWIASRRKAPGSVPQALPWALIGLVVFDVLFIARHYVTTFPVGTMEANDVIRLAHSEGANHRVALVTQEQFYNNWLSILFPYHEVSSINVAQMPRMPMDYQRYLSAVGRNPIRHWDLGAVAMVLGPADIWRQVSADAGLRERFELIYAYNVTPEDGGVRIRPATDSEPGHHVVLRNRAPHHRYALVAGWETVEDEQALQQLASPTFVPFQKVLVSPDSAKTLALPASTAQGVNGSVRVTRHHPGRLSLRISADEPSILRISDKYDPHWKATVNGEPVPLLRVDYLVQGVYVDAGMHHVELRYAPPQWTFVVQGVGLLVCGLALALVLRSRLLRLREASS